MFYSRLCALCKERGINVTNLISELNFSAGNLSRWKKGGEPRGNTLSKLADYFHVSTDYLLGRTDDPRPIDELGGPALVIENGPPGYHALPPEKKAAVDQMVSVLKENEPSNVTPIKISYVAQGGEEDQRVVDTAITLPKSSTKVRAVQEKAGTAGKPSAQEET